MEIKVKYSLEKIYKIEVGELLVSGDKKYIILKREKYIDGIKKKVIIKTLFDFGDSFVSNYDCNDEFIYDGILIEKEFNSLEELKEFDNKLQFILNELEDKANKELESL